jgi:hypothetical protein
VWQNWPLDPGAVPPHWNAWKVHKQEVGQILKIENQLIFFQWIKHFLIRVLRTETSIHQNAQDDPQTKGGHLSSTL